MHTVEKEELRFADLVSHCGAVANGIELIVRPLGEILVPANIVSNGFTIREITRPTDNYQAQNTLDAVYGEVKFNFDDRLRFTLGGRQEKFEQFVIRLIYSDQVLAPGPPRKLINSCRPSA